MSKNLAASSLSCPTVLCFSSKVLSLTFARYWAKYNEELTHITDKGRCEGVVIAKGAGHFIQKDTPSFVSEEITSMLKKLDW